MIERRKDLEIGGSCSVRGETNRGSDVSCEVVWLLAASSFYGAEKDVGNNQGGVKSTPSSPRLRVGVILTDPEPAKEAL